MTMNEITPSPETRIALFQQKEVRRVIHNNEWWFVVEDVVLALIESRDPKQYIQRMKQRDPELGKGWVQIVHTLSIPADGGPQPMLCANTEGLFRIIQSIPSPKAEPFKRWLAKVGYERIQEIEDPELAPKRTHCDKGLIFLWTAGLCGGTVWQPNFAWPITMTNYPWRCPILSAGSSTRFCAASGALKRPSRSAP
jgi:hypothetical protein